MTDQTEQWRPIPGWEDRYHASDQGRVRALSVELRKGLGTYTSKERILPQFPNVRSRYMYVSIWRNGKTYCKSVHRLVAAAFLGPCPDGMEVCHGDGDLNNNRIENLRYGSRVDNMQDAIAHGTNLNTRKTHCKRGHPLVDLNLVPSMSRRGYRSCLACARAHSHISHHKEMKEKMDAIADSYYEEITGASS